MTGQPHDRRGTGRDDRRGIGEAGVEVSEADTFDVDLDQIEIPPADESIADIIPAAGDGHPRLDALVEEGEPAPLRGPRRAEG